MTTVWAYLDRARKSEPVQQLKDHITAWLALPPGGRALDVGCGTGEDVDRMARACEGTAVGVDLRWEFVEEARRRHPRADLSFVMADGRRLPLLSASFDAVRIERTLQHVDDPAAVVAEMARVLRPGGWLCAAEPDWETAVVAGADPAPSRVVIANWIPGRNRNPIVGRHLAGLMASSGLVDRRVEVRGVVYDSFDEADFYFPLAKAATQAAADGILDAMAGQHWVECLRTATEEGRFLFAVSVFLVRARKPLEGTGS